MKWRIALFVVVGLAVGVLGAWLTDAAIHRDQVVRNVMLDDVAVGGLDAAELRAAVEELAGSYELLPVEVRTPGATITTPSRLIGVTVDVESTVSEVLHLGRRIGPAGEFASWAQAFLEPHTAELQFRVDPTVVAQRLELDTDRLHVAPIEPSFRAIEGKLVVSPGVPGRFLAPSDVTAALNDAAAETSPPFAVEVWFTELPPQIDAEAIDTALDAADELTARGLPVSINGHVAVLPTETLRRWIMSMEVDGALFPTFDMDRVQASLERVLADLAKPASPPVFRVVDGEVEVELGEPELVCCGPGAADLVVEAARRGETETVFLPTRLAEPDGGRARVEALGVRELTGEFTTNHSCCQSRVTNIHRIADLIRGQVIMPGEMFSVNEFIGPRTRENGFTAAGVIVNGHFEEDVGGGISQFATTMFNAAFFAGLDIDGYQSHSIYISRYPYGREATLSYPLPDLVVTNPTPYAVLIWTGYTDTSITVQMYSTPHYEVEQTGQNSYRIGSCTRVNTFRSRTAADGSVIEDSFFATYRPAEGLDCNGNPTTRRGG